MPDPTNSAPWSGASAPERLGKDSGSKRAGLLASKIETDIIAMGWPVGHQLGSEVELMERYGVSRSIFREAIRLLEHRMIVESRRGRGGGLFVAEPDPAVIADAVSLFLRYRRVSVRDLFEVRQALELTSVRLAASRAKDDDVARLRALAALPTEPTPQQIADRGAEFHNVVAELSGNAAIHLFVQVVTELTEAMLDHEPASHIPSSVEHAHHGIVEAIANLDPRTAQRRMLRHFEAMTEVGFPDAGESD
ncbi:FadR/GntR family transcriptional regulator [Mycobacterium sp. AZCC_0083]|uniref:FadR/GntR family transcriptional regulator n=1 Tax=Mycobacterium sp. AZCC_0083 TaxID=2735882 RepID=UPI0016083B30|nr:FCD domain-containing protein [Mycobacterium sp. AZCC_0083]MBB5161538.1 DNA-binding FadR family transcriptional regulator [Mycobacterium sp. AZCC_0083]